MKGETITLKQFDGELQKLLPYTEHEKVQFSDRVVHCLSRYLDLVKRLNIDGKPVEGKLLEEIETVCETLYEIVMGSMMGRTSEGFAKLDGLLTGNNDSKCKIGLEELVLKIKPGHDFYRIRLMDSTYGTKRKDLFHISIQSRGQVKSYRYSSPGYPCLYLGESIYGCWEEMRRPAIQQCAVARFVNEKEMNMIDLRIPTEKRLREESCLRQLPLIMACTIRVSDEKAIYRPEYIVPQLLIEWLLTYREYGDESKHEPVYGIMYHSAQMDREFKFPRNKFVNYAIPVFNFEENVEYCKTLCNTFSLTKATTNEQEKLKEDYKNDLPENGSKSESKGWERYMRSDFGQLERRLSNKKEFPLNKINHKDGTDRRN